MVKSLFHKGNGNISDIINDVSAKIFMERFDQLVNNALNLKVEIQGRSKEVIKFSYTHEVDENGMYSPGSGLVKSFEYDNIGDRIYTYLGTLKRNMYPNVPDRDSLSLTERLHFFQKDVSRIKSTCPEYYIFLCSTLGQDPTRGAKDDVKELIGLSGESNIYENFQVRSYKNFGGHTVPYKPIEDIRLDRNGNLTPENLPGSSKSFDKIYEGENVIVFASLKAKVGKTLSGGGDNEYKECCPLLLNRSKRYETLGFEIYKKKIVIVASVGDSIVFDENSNVVRDIQECCTSPDTIFIDSKTLAEYLKYIDVPELLTDTANILSNAFNKFAVEI